MRRHQHKKFNEGVFTRHVVEETLLEFTDDKFFEIVSDFPEEPRDPVQFSFTCSHASIFLAGNDFLFNHEDNNRKTTFIFLVF